MVPMFSEGVDTVLRISIGNGSNREFSLSPPGKSYSICSGKGSISETKEIANEDTPNPLLVFVSSDPV